MKHAFKYCLTAAAAVALMFIALSARGAEKTFDTHQNEIKPVKYVFLFIGDGMSVPQRSMAEDFSTRIGRGKLSINTMPHQAITTTRSANALVTDSAASGTAIACGEKTLNGTLGMDAEHKRNLESIAAVAKKAGRKVGIITTVTLNHATPGAFYAHNPSRGNYYQIALDMINSDFDYFGGGGLNDYDKKDDKKYCGNIYDLARAKGYTVALGPDAAKALPAGTRKAISTGARHTLPYTIDRTEKDLPLAFFVQQAIDVLDNEKGFFIMAEGGMIDYGGHANDAAATLLEMLDFDDAVKVALKFAEKHPQETLIAVTGDHETGGLTLGFAGTGYKSRIEDLLLQKCSRGVLNDKFKALGKAKETVTFEDAQAVITENFSMIFPNDTKRSDKDIVLTDTEAKRLKAAFDRQFPEGKFKSNNALTGEVVSTFNKRCSLSWAHGSHSALPVLTTATGVNSWIFTGFIDNTDVAKRLKLVVK